MFDLTLYSLIRPFSNDNVFKTGVHFQFKCETLKVIPKSLDPDQICQNVRLLFFVDSLSKHFVRITYLKSLMEIQCSPFIRLYFGSIGMDGVVRELFYKGKFYNEITGK